jgi:prolyl 4-hydroxylase
MIVKIQGGRGPGMARSSIRCFLALAIAWSFSGISIIGPQNSKALALASSAPASVLTKEQQAQENDPQSCSWEDQQSCQSSSSSSGSFPFRRDPNLKPISVDAISTDKEPFYAYISPDIATFYNATPGTIQEKIPYHKGLMAKFINLSNQPIRVYWEPSDPNAPNVYIADMEPFGSAGTASHPGHKFVYTPRKDPNIRLMEFSVAPSKSIYPYDPYGSIEDAAAASLTSEELDLYKLQWENLQFSEIYRNATNREWLALYQRKDPPKYFMWPANSFGQTFSIETAETHFVSLPEDHADRQSSIRSLTKEELTKYRYSSSATLNLTLKVLSVEPRVFEIQHFLSKEEITHVLEIAANMRLSQSTTKAGSDGEKRVDDSTRSSKNSWISRERSPILDVIYRRAANLLKIDEALFRYRPQNENEPVLLEESKEPICERLQLVHYGVGQQYTPHHDFSLPGVHDKGQPSRFATILFYLNEGMKGGETSFPKWKNGETSDKLKVVPEAGKAVLFYNQLSDGNYDELSMHAAMPVIEGEKWLTNLWVWSPYMH